jgi:hypothetical protein
MSKRHKITVTFEVIDDDMPSERRLQYRQAMIDAMEWYKKDVQEDHCINYHKGSTSEELRNAELIDKMLGDIYR